jgi:hypothetical protein
VPRTTYLLLIFRMDLESTIQVAHPICTATPATKAINLVYTMARHTLWATHRLVCHVPLLLNASGYDVGGRIRTEILTISSAMAGDSGHQG